MRQVPASLPRRAPPARRLRRSRVPPPGARGTKESEGTFLKQTTNYQLPSWDSEDRILRTDFNDLTEKVDTALKANANAVSSEASTRASAVSSLTTKISQRGNCKAEIKTYTGTGLHGSANPCSQTFSKKPMAIFITGNGYLGICLRSGNTMWIHYSKDVNTGTVTWSGDGRTVSWYSGGADIQMNVSGVTYTVIALLNCDE